MKQSRTVQRRSDRPVLSICMIVKNEEKNLERCLRSLRPLLAGIKSELIITDTGSTDRTVDIAEQYTAHIIHYKWNDDFAAARNTGLDAAKGEWAMAIDADEELCGDLSEVIRFFNSSLRHQFVRASGVMKNVLDVRDRDAITNMQNVNHFYRMDTHPRYEGRIHETVKMESPHYQFGFIGYHYGYAYENDEDKKLKMDRNMSLIRKELEEKPKDLRLLLAALDSVQEHGERMELIERVTEATRASESPIWMTSGYKHLLEEYMDLQQWEKLLEIGKEFESSQAFGSPKMEIVLLDVNYAMATANFCLHQNEDGIYYCDQYLTLYKDYQNGKVDRTVLMFISVNSFYDLRYNKILLMKTEMLSRLKRMEEATRTLSSVFEEKMDSKQLRETFMLAVLLMQQPGIELAAGRFYLALKRMERRGGNWEEEAGRIYLELETRMACCNKENRRKIAGLFLKETGPEMDDFLQTMEALACPELDPKLISNCVLRIQDWGKVYPDLYFQAFRAGVRLPESAFHMHPDRIQVVTDHILVAHGEEFGALEAMAIQMTQGGKADSFQLSFFADLLEKAVRLLDKNLSGGQMAENTRREIQGRLLKEYAEIMGKLLNSCYQPVMLADEFVELLPVFHQRGYWVNQAYQAMESQSFEQCSKCVRALARADKSMKTIAQGIAEEFELRREKAAEEKRKNEFWKLAIEVKRKVRDLIEDGELEQAGQLLTKLKELCPMDEEIRDMLEKAAMRKAHS